MRRKISFIVFLGFLAVVFYYSIAIPFYSQAADDTADVVVTGTVTAGISITASGDLELGDINGFTGGSATGEATWTVKTNNAAGYSISIHKNHLFYTDGGGASKQFADYTEVVPDTPDYTWVTTADNATSFGFSIHSLGGSVTGDQKFLNNGGAPCNVGSTFTAEKCWIDIPTAIPLTVATRSTPTDAVGISTTLNIKAEIGAPSLGNYLTQGEYSATVTATASTL